MGNCEPCGPLLNILWNTNSHWICIQMCTSILMFVQVVPLVPEEFSVAALRLFYDVSFFIIVTTIGLNIVFGIIVDTFSELRDERVSC